MTSQDQSRAEFEAWWSSHGQFCFTDYNKPFLLQGWQAARAAAPALPSTLNDAMRAVLINEHDVYQTPEALYEALLAARRGGPTASETAQTRMDTASGVVAGVLPESEFDLPRAGAEALTEYLRECEENEIVPDVGGAFAHAIRAGALLATQAVPSVPQGWVMVPADPTEVMLAEAFQARKNGGVNRDVWAAMLSAAPQPHKETGI